MPAGMWAWQAGKEIRQVLPRHTGAVLNVAWADNLPDDKLASCKPSAEGPRAGHTAAAKTV